MPGEEGASGTIVARIQVTNLSSHACTLRGYPSFTLYRRGGTVREPVTLVHTRIGKPLEPPVTTVWLGPSSNGGPAYKAGFYLVYTNHRDNGDGGCDEATEMRLTVPGQSGTTAGPVKILVCVATVQVSAYVPASQLRP